MWANNQTSRFYALVIVAERQATHERLRDAVQDVGLAPRQLRRHTVQGLGVLPACIANSQALCHRAVCKWAQRGAAPVEVTQRQTQPNGVVRVLDDEVYDNHVRRR